MKRVGDEEGVRKQEDEDAEYQLTQLRAVGLG